MGIGYCLVNKTKRETISFNRLQINIAKEIAGNAASSAITTWYLLKNSGDEIGFVPDQYYKKDWSYKDVSWQDVLNFKDLTEEVIDELINLKILKDNGIEILDEDEPGNYFRRLENIWMDK